MNCALCNYETIIAPLAAKQQVLLIMCPKQSSRCCILILIPHSKEVLVCID